MLFEGKHPADDYLTEAEKSKDGKLSAEEKKERLENLKKGREKRDKVADKDGDGKATEKEKMELLKKGGKKEASDKQKTLKESTMFLNEALFSSDPLKKKAKAQGKKFVSEKYLRSQADVLLATAKADPKDKKSKAAVQKTLDTWEADYKAQKFLKEQTQVIRKFISGLKKVISTYN